MIIKLILMLEQVEKIQDVDSFEILFGKQLGRVDYIKDKHSKLAFSCSQKV